MTSALTTIIEMVELLPENLQQQVAEHLRSYIADLEDEARWESSFQKTQGRLIAAARRAKQEIAQGKSEPMDYEQL